MLEFQEAWHRQPWCPNEALRPRTCAEPSHPGPRYDPASTYFISAHYLPLLLCRLIDPLGYDAPPSRLQLLRRLTLAWLPVRDGKVQFQEVLFALSRLQVGHSLPPCELRKQLDKAARAKLELGDLRGEEIVWNAHEYFAAEFITKVYRGFRARGFLHTARQRRIKAERTTAAYAREASTGRRCHPPPREARPCPRRGHRYQLSSTLMLSVIDDDARSYSELSARHAHLLSAGRHLGRAQAAAIIRDAWLRRSTAEPI